MEHFWGDGLSVSDEVHILYESRIVEGTRILEVGLDGEKILSHE